MVSYFDGEEIDKCLLLNRQWRSQPNICPNTFHVNSMPEKLQYLLYLMMWIPKSTPEISSIECRECSLRDPVSYRSMLGTYNSRSQLQRSSGWRTIWGSYQRNMIGVCHGYLGHVNFYTVDYSLSSFIQPLTKLVSISTFHVGENRCTPRNARLAVKC